MLRKNVGALSSVTVLRLKGSALCGWVCSFCCRRRLVPDVGGSCHRSVQEARQARSDRRRRSAPDIRGVRRAPDGHTACGEAASAAQVARSARQTEARCSAPARQGRSCSLRRGWRREHRIHASTTARRIGRGRTDRAAAHEDEQYVTQ